MVFTKKMAIFTMNEHYKLAESLIKETISDFNRFLPQDGEDISYYYSVALNDSIMRLIRAKDEMVRGEMVEISENK